MGLQVKSEGFQFSVCLHYQIEVHLFALLDTIESTVFAPNLVSSLLHCIRGEEHHNPSRHPPDNVDQGSTDLGELRDDERSKGCIFLILIVLRIRIIKCVQDAFFFLLLRRVSSPSNRKKKGKGETNISVQAIMVEKEKMDMEKNTGNTCCGSLRF